MAGPLAQIFSTADTFKRKLADALRNPSDTVAQFVGHANDRARVFNELTSAATQETINALRNGGNLVYGPANQKLAGVLADAYNPAGMVVWHGSPHGFVKFDSSKIGTGEGNQAYGHGLYLAEKQGVATAYSDGTNGIHVGGKRFDVAIRSSSEDPTQAMKWKLVDQGMDEKQATVLSVAMESQDPKSRLLDLANKNNGNEYGEIAKKLHSDLDLGYLYKVDLPDEQIAKMLDFDKPLGEQPHILKALESHPTMGKESRAWKGAPIGQWEKAMSSPSRTGEWLYRELADTNPAQAEAARQIAPGIRYLDAGSRGNGAGTSNFVIFPGNEDMLKILERNGQPLGLLGVKPQNVAAGGGQMGAVYPRQKALETAQRNAAKPISEGGLGLPANNTPMDRARAMGFETAPAKTTYHGARGEIIGPIDPAKSDFGFHTGTLDQAESRLRTFAPKNQNFPEGANVMPLMKSRYANMMRVKDEGSFHADALAPQLARKGVVSKEWAKQAVKAIDDDWRKAAEYDNVLRRAMAENDYHGIVYANAQEGAGNSFAFSDPSVLRSRFAAFDPARINENDLLGRADPRLLGLLGLGTAGGVGAYNYMQGK